MKRTFKNSFAIPLSYGLIIATINNIIPIIFSHAIKAPEFIGNLANFTETPSTVIKIGKLLTHLLPALLCIFYVSIPTKNYKKRFINIPIVFSSFGIIGWLLDFLYQLCLVFININKGNNSFSVLGFSAFNSIFAGVITFTLSYFALESIHRRFILPSEFPEGKILQIPGVKKISVSFLFTIYHISVALLPVFFIFSLYIITIHQYNIKSDSHIIIIFIVMLIMGLLVTRLFTKDFFEIPLRKFKDRIQKLNDGDYSSNLHIVTNDFFGEFADVFNEMTNSIQEKQQKILDAQNSIIKGMALMVESRDNNTGGHIKRTSECVKVFVTKLMNMPEYQNIPREFFLDLIKAAPMHDLGKIAVDDAILRKTDKFTPEEYEVMKTHSSEGAKLVAIVLKNIDDFNFKKIALNVAHYHHEKWNGQGYPQKLNGEQIPLEARIMALADVFDALVSKRSYKEKFSFEKAFSIIQESLGSHFDPTLGKIFLECRPNLEELYKKLDQEN